MEKKKLEELGSLWKRESKAGNEFFTGRVGNFEVIIFPNNKKAEGSKQPDFRVYKSEPMEQKPQNPANNFGFNAPKGGADFKIEFGKKYAGKMASSIPRDQLENYVDYVENSDRPSASGTEFVKKAKAFLG
jgi:hypothetical protein